SQVPDSAFFTPSGAVTFETTSDSGFEIESRSFILPIWSITFESPTTRNTFLQANVLVRQPSCPLAIPICASDYRLPRAGVRWKGAQRCVEQILSAATRAAGPCLELVLLGTWTNRLTNGSENSSPWCRQATSLATATLLRLPAPRIHASWDGCCRKMVLIFP